jgi:hypothetical protein
MSRTLCVGARSNQLDPPPLSHISPGIGLILIFPNTRNVATLNNVAS